MVIKQKRLYILKQKTETMSAKYTKYTKQRDSRLINSCKLKRNCSCLRKLPKSGKQKYFNVHFNSGTKLQFQSPHSYNIFKRNYNMYKGIRKKWAKILFQKSNLTINRVYGPCFCRWKLIQSSFHCKSKSRIWPYTEGPINKI